jgi:hypothetical protein
MAPNSALASQPETHLAESLCLPCEWVQDGCELQVSIVSRGPNSHHSPVTQAAQDLCSTDTQHRKGQPQQQAALSAGRQGFACAGHVSEAVSYTLCT